MFTKYNCTNKFYNSYKKSMLNARKTELYSNFLAFFWLDSQIMHILQCFLFVLRKFKLKITSIYSIYPFLNCFHRKHTKCKNTDFSKSEIKLKKTAEIENAPANRREMTIHLYKTIKLDKISGTESQKTSVLSKNIRT